MTGSACGSASDRAAVGDGEPRGHTVAAGERASPAVTRLVQFGFRPGPRRRGSRCALARLSALKGERPLVEEAPADSSAPSPGFTALAATSPRSFDRSRNYELTGPADWSPMAIEPPVGFEPTAYALQVVRSWSGGVHSRPPEVDDPWSAARSDHDRRQQTSPDSGQIETMTETATGVDPLTQPRPTSLQRLRPADRVGRFTDRTLQPIDLRFLPTEVFLPLG